MLQVALFPEGTTTNRKCLISFKTGAFQPGVPVQPVVVKWPNHFDCVTWAFVGPSVLVISRFPARPYQAITSLTNAFRFLQAKNVLLDFRRRNKSVFN